MKKQITLKIKTIIFCSCVAHFSFSQVGAVSTLTGSTSGNSDGLGTAALLNKPYGICVSNDGSTMYFTDTYNHLIRRVDLITNQVTTIAGNGTAGSANGIGTNASFNFPKGICISNNSQFLFIADTENHKIRKLNLATNAVSTLAGTGAMGGVTNSKGHLATFNLPEGVEINNDDSFLYVADADNHTIRRIDLVTDSMVTTAAGDGGDTGGGYMNGQSTTAKFKNPRGLCISHDGLSLYIGDNNNHCIRKLDITSGAVTTYAGVGGSASSGNVDGDVAISKFSNPGGITMSSNSEFLYIADNSNLVIRKISLIDDEVSTLAGGLWGFADNTDGSLAKFASPIDIEISGDNELLYVADLLNNRIRIVRALPEGTALVKEISLDNSCYPNPAAEYLVIDLQHKNEIAQVAIIALDGKTVQDVDPTSQFVDVSALNDGTYILRTIYKNGIVDNVKFVKE